MTLTHKEINIIRGADVIFTITLTNEDTGLPFSLADATQVKVILVNQNKTLLNLVLTDGVAINSPSVGGQAQVTLSAARTALLKLDLKQTIEVEVTKPSGVTILQFLEVLNVRDRLKP